MNRWNIPSWLEKEVLERDQSCIYCGVKFNRPPESRKASPTWEHIINDATIISRENIARCCFSCNASKGAKELRDWLDSEYCITKGITPDNVADIAKKALTSSTSPKTIAD